jgi:hypothetical protein
MQNKTLKSVLLIGLLLALLGSAYYAWTKTKKPAKKTPTTSSSANNYQINNDIYKNLANPRDFGGTISTDAAGFGRENPFAPYK